MPVIIGPSTGLAPETPGVVCDVPNYSSLDDDSLLLMLQTRMGDLDEQIGRHMRTLEDSTAEARRIGGEIQRFQAVRELLSREPHMDVATGQLRLDNEVDGGMLVAVAERLGLRVEDLHTLDTNGAGGVSVQELLDHVNIDGASLGGVTSRETLQLRSEDLSEALRQCNSTNEQTMVRMQSAMQQRTQAVTMATNMLKALDESRDAVVGNLR